MHYVFINYLRFILYICNAFHSYSCVVLSIPVDSKNEHINSIFVPSKKWETGQHIIIKIWSSKGKCDKDTWLDNLSLSLSLPLPRSIKCFSVCRIEFGFRISWLVGWETLIEVMPHFCVERPWKQEQTSMRIWGFSRWWIFLSDSGFWRRVVMC
jgi:hypothetical protein